MFPDIRYALRVFAKNPGVTAVATLSLAVAIGPNSALFSVVDGVLLRTAPIKHSEQFFRISLPHGNTLESLSYPDYIDVRNQSTTLAGLLAYSGANVFLMQEGQREILPINFVSDNFFSTLEVSAAAGRTLLPGRDERFEGPPPIVLSYSLWQRRFAADPGIVGRSVLLNGKGFAVVGVAQRDFRGLNFIVPTEAWLPFSAMQVLNSRDKRMETRNPGNAGIQVLARIRQGFTKQQAEMELSTLAARLSDSYPAFHKARQARLYEPAGGGTFQLLITTLVLTLVSLVLLIACANVASLLLAQGEARRRETAVRLALGASRWRLIRQWLTESLLLSLGAAALGLLFARWLIALAPVLKPPIPIPLNYDIRLDARVLGYTLFVSLLTVLLVGLAPALRASKPEVVGALKGDQGPRRSGWFSLRSLLVISQIAVSQLLLTGAFLLVRSYIEAQHIRPGFDTGKELIVLFTVATVEAAQQGAPLQYQQVLERVRALPGVRRASYSRRMPLSGSGMARQKVSLPGRLLPSGEDSVETASNAVAPEYFETMGTRLLRGRGIQRGDGSRTLVINQTMARLLWPGEDPVGRSLRTESAGDCQVVGMVEDGKYGDLYESPAPYMFFAVSGASAGEAYFVVESGVDPKVITPALRREIAAAEPNLMVLTSATLKQHMGLALFLPQTGAGLIGAIGLLAIFLASVGLYGVVSYAVNRRAHEIGVRMAMGAQPRNVLGLILGQGLRLVGIGMIIGLAAALAGAGILSHALYGISAKDPIAFAGSALLVIVIALVATHIPARRAVHLDPMMVLRRE